MATLSRKLKQKKTTAISSDHPRTIVSFGEIFPEYLRARAIVPYVAHIVG